MTSRIRPIIIHSVLPAMPPLLLERKRVSLYFTLLAIDISSFSVIRAEQVATDAPYV